MKQDPEKWLEHKMNDTKMLCDYRLMLEEQGQGKWGEIRRVYDKMLHSPVMWSYLKGKHTTENVETNLLCPMPSCLSSVFVYPCRLVSTDAI